MSIKEIANEVSSAKLLGLGESSHGTHEFFEFKSRLFQELVISHGFDALLFEDSQTTCMAINRYISQGEGDLGSLMKRLYPVWNVGELKQLILWLRQNHEKYKVEFIGFDIQQTNESLPKRDELMSANIKSYVEGTSKSKAVVWAHNSHIQTISSNFNQRPTGMFLRKYFKDDYVAIGLLFGSGAVSATKLKMDANPNRDRRLSQIDVRSIPPEIAEYALSKLNSKPYFLKKDELNKLTDKLMPVRSIGWGLVPELVNKVTEQTDIQKAFDGVVYFPVATASQPLH